MCISDFDCTKKDLRHDVPWVLVDCKKMLCICLGVTRYIWWTYNYEFVCRPPCICAIFASVAHYGDWILHADL